MDVIIKGVRITLTQQQVAKIEIAKNQRQRCRNSFVRMLKHFGFKKIDTAGWENPKALCFENETCEWFAEIQNYGNWDEVFMAGKGLKNVGFPGGYMYGTPQEIEEELLKAIKENDW